MKKLVSAALAAAATSSVSAALACGGSFGAGVNVDPAQDIIVVHKDSTETYVFQPTFCGDAKDFGLVLPVPSQLSSAPELSAPEAFEAAVDITKPEIVDRTECLAKESDGAGAPGRGSPDDVTVVGSGRVGFLDWSQLKAESAESFTSWLDANGYVYPDEAKAAFASYAEKGWYFLAFKVSQGAPTGPDDCRAFGPVKLSFPTETPVVPTRIATVGQSLGDFFSWRVFGITESTSQLGFANDNKDIWTSLEYAGALSAPDAARLSGLAAPGDRLTRLVISFSGTSTEDVRFAKKAPADYRGRIVNTRYLRCVDGEPVSGAPGDDAPAPATSSCSTTAGHGGSIASLAGFALVASAMARRRRRQ